MEKVTSLQQAGSVGLMDFALSRGLFTLIHSNTDGKKRKKDKSFAAALPGQTDFSVVLNGYNDDEVHFLTPHLKLYFLYLALSVQNFPNFRHFRDVQ